MVHQLSTVTLHWTQIVQHKATVSAEHSHTALDTNCATQSHCISWAQSHCTGHKLCSTKPLYQLSTVILHWTQIVQHKATVSAEHSQTALDTNCAAQSHCISWAQSHCTGHKLCSTKPLYQLSTVTLHWAQIVQHKATVSAEHSHTALDTNCAAQSHCISWAQSHCTGHAKKISLKYVKKFSTNPAPCWPWNQLAAALQIWRLKGSRLRFV